MDSKPDVGKSNCRSGSVGYGSTREDDRISFASNNRAEEGEEEQEQEEQEEAQEGQTDGDSP
jgi:hypothetical protein